MYYSSHSRAWRTLVVCVLTVLMLTSICLTANAAKTTDVAMETLFELTADPETNQYSNGSDSRFTWKNDGSNSSYNQGTTQTNTPLPFIRFWTGYFAVTDTTAALTDYEAVAVDFDVFFEGYPASSSGDSPDPSSEKYSPQPIVTWCTINTSTNSTSFGGAQDGLYMDADGYLYSSVYTASAFDTKLDLNKWYNIKLVYSQTTAMVELWLDGVLVGTAPCTRRTSGEDTLRILHTKYLFYNGDKEGEVLVKNVKLSATDTPYYCGVIKEDSSDFISYQTTKPDTNGAFNLRVLAGINSTKYDHFGYRVLVLTKDASGNVTEKEITGTDKSVYSSVFGGSTEYKISELFGYEYAGLATIENLNANLPFTELVIFPYTVSPKGEKIYGTPMSLVYGGEMDANGYPVFTNSTVSPESVVSGADIAIVKTSNSETWGDAKELKVQSVKKMANDGYRAAYFKFTVPSATVAELSELSRIKLKIYVTQITDNNNLYDMIVYDSTTAWDETYQYSNFYSKISSTSHSVKLSNARGSEIDRIPAADYKAGSYLIFDVTDYVKTKAASATGDLTLSFCVTPADNSSNVSAGVWLAAREHANQPTLEFQRTLYGHSISNAKNLNEGYEPLSYAEALVDEWFGGLKDKIYARTASNNNALELNGYGSTAATDDFKQSMDWISGTPWTTETNSNGKYMSDTSDWSSDKFARTLSTLGQSKAVSFLNSSYAETETKYDSYGGIANSGMTQKATGYFYITEINGTPYIIDPDGNPYFAASVNQLNLGDSSNQKTYSLAAYGTKEAYFEDVSTQLKAMGINTAFVSDSDALLAVDGGLNVVVGLDGVSSYMAKLGRSQISEGIYPHNNTINVFDPDFAKLVNTRNERTIREGGYANNERVLGYTADNELPAGTDVLYRYLTLDPTVYDNIFSYHTAWTWFGEKLIDLNPTLSDYLALSDTNKKAYNSEFLSFLYAHYYKTVKASIEIAANDKNHMYFGSRAFQECKTDEGYLRAAGYYLDALTLNLYGGLNPDLELINGLYKYSGKPFIVTEFFAKATDAIDANGYKLANSTGAGILVFSQADRANYYEHYVLTLLESKTCVGWSWYRFRDNDQSLYTIKEPWSKDKNTYANLRPLYMQYSTRSPYTMIDPDGNVYLFSDLYYGKQDYWEDRTKTYAGEAIASNQNVNKGIFNGDFSTTVTVWDTNPSYTNDYDFGSTTYEVLSVNGNANFTATDFKTGATLTVKKAGYDLATDTTGMTMNITFDANTRLTTFNGKYVELSSSIQNISENLLGIVNYFAAN